MHGNNWNWGMGMGMGIWWIVGFALLIAVVWFIVRAANSGNAPSQKQSALDRLNQRYALGEISKEEYLEMKNKISS